MLASRALRYATRRQVRATRRAPSSVRYFATKDSSTAKQDPGEPKSTVNYDGLRPVLDFPSYKENRYKHTMNIEKRGAKKYADLDKVIDLFDEHNTLKKEIKALNAERLEKLNLSKDTKDEHEKADLIDDCEKIVQEVALKEVEVVQVWDDLVAAGDKIPNWTHSESPIGPEENARAVSYNGKKTKIKFKPRDHVDLMMKHNMVDFKGAADVTNGKFSALKNGGAFLEMALINWSMAEAAKQGFTPIMTPDLVHTKVAEACGFKPRSKNSENYLIEGKDNLILTGTAEIPLAGMFIDKVIDGKDLPVKVIGYGHAFRKESGRKQLKRKGMTNSGLYRVRQFAKTEMFVICKEEDSEKWHQQLLDIQGEMMKQLNVHYRVLEMPSEELGRTLYRKFDIEAWMPGRDNYGEVTSCSNCLDHQSRRLGIQYKDSNGELKFAHTLNATSVAVPRMILTILENYQDEKGNIKIPPPLEPYYFGPKLQVE